MYLYICTSFNPRILFVLIVNQWNLLLFLCNFKCNKRKGWWDWKSDKQKNWSLFLDSPAARYLSRNISFLLFLFFSCFLWTVYGHLIGDWLLILVNSIGCFLQAVYIFIFMQNCDNKVFYLSVFFLINGFLIQCLNKDSLTKELFFNTFLSLFVTHKIFRYLLRQITFCCIWSTLMVSLLINNWQKLTINRVFLSFNAHSYNNFFK